MKISGFQKMTMLDFPGKIATTVFTYGCNMRCPFCHNASLVTEKCENEIPESEIFAYLEKRKGILDGVCITGGEPLLQSDIKDFVIKVKRLGYAVKLDTNGTNPVLLKELINEKLVDYVAMDIKNSFLKYNESSGLKCADIVSIKESIDLLLENNVDYEFRTTVVKELHTIDDIIEIAKTIKGAKRYYIQVFIDSGNLICDGFTALPKEDMEKMASETKQYVGVAEVRGI